MTTPVLWLIRTASTSVVQVTPYVSDAQFKRTVADALNSIMQFGSGLRPGTIIPFAGTFPPPGWIICDGSEVSKLAYRTLYEEIGDSFGEASSDEMFKLPDLRGGVAPEGKAEGETPTQTVGDGGTVSVEGAVISAPETSPLGTSGGSGGNITTGGRALWPLQRAL